MRNNFIYVIALFLALSCSDRNQSQTETAPEHILLATEMHRPVFHFTPDSMWMNDPNGMVFYKDTYHLFYQYYPDSTVWGPMHWGHAVSKDMIDWESKPIALFPDENGYIFSGSAVLDINNTSGFGTTDNPALVAVFTYHNPKKAQADKIDVESQGIAFSIDKGETWEKYAKNPVLANPGIRDFRDPKVSWYEPKKRWIMTLAAQDHIRFYSSPDLKEWKLESEFGKQIGAHGGVWECPDLFTVDVSETGDKKWILIVSINPGGPNGGSGTQYFIGDFDGNTFTPDDTKIRWIDYGPDDYAGVTWSNTQDRKLFIGWMSNWKYANIVPTKRWRSAMTVARELSLRKVNGALVLCSLPVEELDQYTSPVYEAEHVEVHDEFNLSEAAKTRTATFELDLEIKESADFKVVLTNEVGNEVSLFFDKIENRFKIDRSKSGDLSFLPDFGAEISADRTSNDPDMKLKLLVDVASAEIFADSGSTVLTSIYFPDEVLNTVKIVSKDKLRINKLSFKQVR